MEAHGYVGDLLNNMQAQNVLHRDGLVALYYLAGYSIQEIMGFLTIRHGAAISERQIHRILRGLNLMRRNNESSLEDIITAIQEELAGSGRNIGYRLMRRRLLDHDLNASLETVRIVLTVLDADGVRARGRHVLRRRQYLNSGPNFALHMDGWDKLKPFGISIHAAIDGYSRRVLWLKACNSNKNPQYIAHFYLNYIREINGVPSLIYADRGTENVIVRDIQYALRWHHGDCFEGLSSFVYGSSNRNSRIERFWRNLRSMCGQSWIDVLKGMAEYGILDTSDMIHLECVRFCFMSLIDVDLKNTQRYWNEHRIRRTRTAIGPFGKPDVLYFQPELYGSRDFRMPLPANIDGIEQHFTQDPPINGVSEQFNAVARAIILQKGLVFPPRTKDDAIEIFCEIILAINDIQ